MEIKITRVYTGSDGESHFEDVELPLEDRGEGGLPYLCSEFMKPTGIFFTVQEHTSERDWHNAPHRQFLIRLEGESEMEISDGTRRRLGPGGIVLAEDTTGRGHKGRVIKSPRKTVVVTLD
ncbi:hypothetical protein ACFLVG_00200 [Chloroflexota bacterium]